MRKDDVAEPLVTGLDRRGRLQGVFGQALQGFAPLLRRRVGREEYEPGLLVLVRLVLADKVLPELRRFPGVIADLSHQSQTHAVGLALLVAAEGGDASHGDQTGDLPGHRNAAKGGADLEEDQGVGRRLGVPPPMQGMAPEVMAELVPKHGGKLGFVAGAQQQAGPNHHDAVGRHGGVEIGHPEKIDPDIGTVGPGEPADDALDISVQRLVPHEIAGGLELAFRPVHHHPPSRLVGGEGGALAGAEVGNQRHARTGAGGDEAGCGAAFIGERRVAVAGRRGAGAGAEPYRDQDHR